MTIHLSLMINELWLMKIPLFVINDNFIIDDKWMVIDDNSFIINDK